MTSHNILLNNRYRLVKTLGAGSQGTAWLAFDNDKAAEKNEVVIKQLHLRNASSWKDIDLLKREAAALKHLDHPAIPRCLDFFEYDPEQQDQEDTTLRGFYLVQTYMSGESLQKKLDDGWRPTEIEARKILQQLLDILQYLHQFHPPYVHRDIKPANILVQDDGKVSLVDFGGVQAVIADTGGGSTIVGTNGYMPPEQLMGRASTASDLYALGATLIHVLSGRHPSSLPMERMELQFQRFVTISPPLKKVLEKLIKPNVEDRYQKATDVKHALQSEEQQQQKQMQKLHQKKPYLVDTEKEVTRRRTLVSSIFMVIFLGVIGFFFWLGVDDHCYTASTCYAAANKMRKTPTLERLQKAAEILSENCFTRSHLDSCYDLGRLYEVGDPKLSFASDPVAAFKAYAEACPFNDVQAASSYSCFAAGYLYDYGKIGVSSTIIADHATAALYYDRGCNLGSAGACNNFGVIKEKGLGGHEVDKAAAAQLYSKACDAKDQIACANLGDFYIQGVGVPRDVKKALSLLEKSCELKTARACHLLGEIYRHGDGVPHDPLRANRFYEQGCKMEKPSSYACTALGYQFEIGNGVEKNVPKAIEAYEKACANGGMTGCTNLVSLHFAGKYSAMTDADAVKKATYACEQNAYSCNMLGWMHQEGKSVEKNLEKAEEYYTRACRAASGLSCLNLAKLLKVRTGQTLLANSDADTKAQHQKIREYGSMACTYNYLDGCVWSGYEMFHGLHGSVDKNQALAFYKKACDGGNAIGCNNLATLYEGGVLVKKDMAQAASYYEQACDKEEPLGCNNLAELYETGNGVPKDQARAVLLRQRAEKLKNQ